MPRNIFDGVYRKFSRFIKTQKTQLDDLYDLEEKTNRLLMQNQKNQKKQAREIAKAVSGTSIKSKTLENTWKTLTVGIDDTEKIKKDAHKKREKEKNRLQTIKNDFNSSYRMPDKRKK